MSESKLIDFEAENAECYEDVEDDEIFVLTPYAVFLSVLGDYGIDISHITPRMAEHMFDDLMESLYNQGYVGRKEGGDSE